MRRRRLATLGRQTVVCGDEHDPPVCEKCLVVGAYRRRPCPTMPQWTGPLPVNRPLVDLTQLLQLLSVSRTALAAHVANAAASEATRFSVGGSTIPGTVGLRGGCSCPLSRNAGRVTGAAVVRGGLAWASNFAKSSGAAPGTVRVSLGGGSSLGALARRPSALYADSAEHRRLSWHCIQPGW